MLLLKRIREHYSKEREMEIEGLNAWTKAHDWEPFLPVLHRLKCGSLRVDAESLTGWSHTYTDMFFQKVLLTETSVLEKLLLSDLLYDELSKRLQKCSL